MAALRRSRARYAPQLAPDFDMFDFLRKDEHGLNIIFSWLLDGDASHAQGNTFVSALLRVAGLEWPVGRAPCRVRREVHIANETHAGRLDIVARLGDYILAIENKPDARWQDLQLSRYLTYLQSTYPDKFKLLVFMGWAASPHDAVKSHVGLDWEIHQSNVVVLSYGDIRLWLESCRNLCLSDRIAHFIQELIRHIERRFMGIEDKTVMSELANSIALSPDLIAPAFEIIQSAQILEKKIQAILCEDMRKIASGAHLEIEIDDNYDSGGDKGFRFFITDGHDIYAMVGFEHKRFDNIFFGVSAKSKTSLVDKIALRRRIEDIYTPRSGEDYGDWIYWNYISETNHSLPPALQMSANSISKNPGDIWTAWANGTFAKASVELALKIQQILSD
ncbi:PD-(D/E)XK nuclease family protein [Methylobacterium aquaticum]|uniref:PD-(D/E)XK nuclease family protein n=1 Tax=Methylobacterium aquaticum TaxID=270351 RepID=UPI003D177CF0